MDLTHTTSSVHTILLHHSPIITLPMSSSNTGGLHFLMGISIHLFNIFIFHLLLLHVTDVTVEFVNTRSIPSGLLKSVGC